MLTPTSLDQSSVTNLAARPASLLRQRLLWTCGNLLMLAGIYMLLYVGGLYVQIEYQRLAARGDNDIAPPRMTLDSFAAPAFIPAAPPQMADFNAPQLNVAADQISSALPDTAQLAHGATIERLVIPSIAVDSKVIEVGWSSQEIGGKLVAVWNVAEYAVGQHRGSANPGEGGNVVLAGHVGGYGKVFRDLFYVKPGDQITLYSAGEQYLYSVQARLVVDENGVPPEQQAENATLIGPTDSEMVTLITCWPLSGPDKYKQRVIVRATPFSSAPVESLSTGPGANIIR